MKELNKNELFNINGGAVNTLPNFQIYGKIIKFVIGAIKSWF
jgi:lactobin A/cerein 7B family class IIb bacteriocin